MNTPNARALRCGTISGGFDVPCPDAAAVLATARRVPWWDTVWIAPEHGEYPRVNITWHEGLGFVEHCFEIDISWGFFLAENEPLAPPTVPIQLGPDREIWPRQLFVRAELAIEGLEGILAGEGLQKSLSWIGTGEFIRG